MKKDESEFKKLLSETEKRFQLIRKDLINSSTKDDDFLSEAFIRNKYIKSIKNSLILYGSLLTHKYVGFNGKSIIDLNKVTIVLDEKNLTPHAEVIGINRKKNQLFIEISIGFFIILDIFLGADVPCLNEFFPDEKIKHPDFYSLSSTYFKNIIDKNFPNGISDLVKKRISNHIFNSEEYVQSLINYRSVMTILWVVTHEYGHHVCGHETYYKSRITNNMLQSLGIGENELEDFLSPKKRNYGHYLRRWGAELMVDSYATFRLIWFGSQEIANGNWKLTSTEFKNLICAASTLPSIYALIREKNVDTKTAKEILFANYPPNITRVFNIVASINYSLFFFHNKAHAEAKNSIEAEFYSNRITLGYQLLEFFESTINSINDFGVIFKFQKSNSYKAHFLGSLQASREGLVTSLMYGLGSYISLDFSTNLGLWMQTMKQLSVNYNSDFALFLNKRLFDSSIKDDSLHDGINDPAYYVINNWMSNIYSCHIYSSEDEVTKKMDEYLEAGIYFMQNIKNHYY